jgi:antirestriction protein ArdC
MRDAAAYIASWLNVLKDDKRAIFTAASHAQKAAANLHGLQTEADTAPAERGRKRGVGMSRAPFIIIDGKRYPWKGDS